MTDPNLADLSPDASSFEDHSLIGSVKRASLSLPDVLGGVSLLVAFAVWSRLVTHGTGGIAPGVLTKGLAVALVAAVLNRPWRTVPRVALVLSGLIPAAALTVCLFAPTGWAGLSDTASFAYASAMFCAVAGFARTPGRVALVAAATILVGFDEFGMGWLVWWGRGVQSHPFYGTFDWYNQTGGYFAPALVLAASAAVSGKRAYRIAGWAAGPFLGCGILFSTSRGSLAAALLGVAVVAVAALRQPGRKGTVLRLAAFGGVTVALAFTLTGPPVFHDRVNPISGIQQRASEVGGSVAGNSTYRLYYMRAAAGEFIDRPVVGGGFGSFGQAAPSHLPYKFTTLSLYAHNGVLQAFSDGGLVLGLPVAAAVLGMLIAGLFAAVRGSGLAGNPQNSSTDTLGWAAWGAAGAVAATISHGIIDYDWSRPTCLAMTAVTGALAVAAARTYRPVSAPSDHTTTTTTTTRLRQPVPVLASAFTFTVVALSIGGSSLADGAAARINQLKLGPLSINPVGAAVMLREGDSQSLPDPRLDGYIIRLAGDGAYGPHGIPDTTLRAALAGGSHQIAQVDPTQIISEAIVRVHLGQNREAIQQARQVAESTEGYHRLPLVGGYATVLYLSGHKQQATQVLTTRLAAILKDNYPRPGAESLLQPLFQYEGITASVSRCAYRYYLDAYPDAKQQPAPLGLTPATAGCQL